MHNDADLCRARGWKPGTKLLVTETDGEQEIQEIHQITAIGLRKVLSTMIAYKDTKSKWFKITDNGCWESTEWADLNHATEWTQEEK